MLKRRNWRELHGTGPQEDDSQDSGSGSAPASESDDLESQPSGDEDLADRRLEDLTDSSEGSDEEDASAPGTSSTEDEEALAANQNPGQNGAADYWAPRRCKLCPGVLLLNPTSLQQHTASKKHRRLLGQDADDTFDPIVLAEEVEEPGKFETHAERLARTRSAADKPAGLPSHASTKQASSKKPGNGEKRRQRRDKAPNKRPGKRQRAAAKTAGTA